jgi:hypothetical protein
VCSDKARVAREAGTPIAVSTFGEGTFTLGSVSSAGDAVATPLGGAR